MNRLHHYNHERYRLEFLATDFQHRWQKYFTSRDWLKPETAHEKSVAPTQGLTKRAGEEIRHNSWVNCDAGFWVNNSLAILWLYQYRHANADYKAFQRTFAVIIRRTFRHGNSVYPYRIWLVMTCFRWCEKIETSIRRKTPCHSSFSGGDHLQCTSRISCGVVESFWRWENVEVSTSVDRSFGHFGCLNSAVARKIPVYHRFESLRFQG